MSAAQPDRGLWDVPYRVSSDITPGEAQQARKRVVEILDRVSPPDLSRYWHVDADEKREMLTQLRAWTESVNPRE